MKKFLFCLALSAICTFATAAAPKGLKYVDAQQLTHIGKLFTDTPNPYHRVDTVKFKGFTRGENFQMRCSAGQAILFKTDSRNIAVQIDYGNIHHALNGTDLSYSGCDLYIRVNGKWKWAGEGVNANKKEPFEIVLDMDGSQHECMLYLPMYSELYSVMIGVDEDSSIIPMESPFHNRIGIFGSSFTQGVSTSRSGMTYPMILQRMTGYQILSIAASGNCKMQDYFADVICAAEFDAFIFDSFSNPNAKMIEERLEPFIAKIRKAHPTEPLIFQQTIYRERRYFNTKHEASERAKQETAARLMKEMCKKYPNVYFIEPDACDKYHEATVDGVHPDDYGYQLWAQSIAKPVTKILKKHGIK